ncbi:MAG TPA: OmpA family protein [Aquabacterium sp.]|uniref:OmpA family protein n=1 Tax=Aquabacterium sp. TaxID=1872578 RepID=UPI002E2ED9B7|nr:OmpA family protein [Aquabacterium sp.]HEX5372606.1 OmpA family protein [Aquabacterium sp.]
MTASNALRLLSLATLSTWLLTPAHAQYDAYYYGGLSVGQARASFDKAAIANGLLAPGQTATAIRSDDRDTAYKVFLGYQFNTYVALEGGYFNLGKFSFDADTTPTGTLSGRLKVQGGNLDLVGTMPMSDRWALIARIGAQYAKAKGSFLGTGAVSVSDAERTENKTNAKIGVGLQYEINPSWLVRGEVERYRIHDTVGDHGNVNVYSLSMVFPFDRMPRPAPRVAAAPVYQAPAPAPAPVVPPAPSPRPEPTPPQRLSLSAESLFTFDRSELRAEGKGALDTFASSLSGAQYSEVVVEGHTDRLGSEAYNQTLSEQRAEAVKAHLVSSGRLDAARISAVGKGESAPVTRPQDCQGNKRSVALLACLQPDRRVDIHVNATR